MTSLKSETAYATRWSSITEVTSRLVLPLVNIVLARLLTPEAFGIVATITMIVSFAEIFADAGFQKYIVQHVFSCRKELDENTNVAFWTNLSIAIFIWFIIYIYRDGLAVMVGNPGLGNVIAVSSISLPLIAFSSIQMSRFKRDMDFKTLFFVRIIAISVPVFVTLPIAFFTHSFWALIIGTIMSNLVNAIVLTLRSPWKPRLFYSWKQLKAMFSYSWWILLESITTWLTSYSDTFIVSVSMTAFYVGLYKTSMVTVNQITGLIAASVSAPLFVALSRLQNDPQKLETTYNDYMQAVAYFIFPLSAGIWFFRDFITLILLGSQWTEASDFIGLWGLTSSVALVLGTFANGLYNAVGKTFLSFSVALANLALMVPILIWAAPKGFECVYISRSLLRVPFVIIQLMAMALFLRYHVTALLKKLLPVLIPTILMSVCAAFMQPLSTSIIWSILCIILCMGVYFGTTYIWNKNLLIQSCATLGILPQRFLTKNV